LIGNQHRITAIEVQERRKDRRSIFVDGRFVVGVDEDVIADLGLKVGQQFSEDELNAVVRAEILRKAKERALNLLSYRARSRKELAGRLRRAGYDEEIVEETLSRLENTGLIDDAQFSQGWVNSRVSGKGLGKVRVRWELRQKGVASEVVEEALSSVDPDERKLAADAARRRWEKDKDPDLRARRRRVASYLQRQGFEWQLVSEMMEKLVDEAHNSDEG
jgi:regulatory protein